MAKIKIESTASIEAALEDINTNLLNLATLIISQKEILERLDVEVESNRVELQTQLDDIRGRVDAAYKMAAEAITIAQGALASSVAVDKLSLEFAESMAVARELADNSRKELSLAQERVEKMRVEMIALKEENKE